MRVRTREELYEAAASVRRATIGITDPLTEGTDETRRAAREALQRERRLEVARANRRWLELDPEDLEPRGRWLLADTTTGLLYQRLGAEVFPNGNPQFTFNEELVAAFVVEHGEPRFLRRPRGGPQTVAELEELEERRR